jgi:hypothetical protein
MACAPSEPASSPEVDHHEPEPEAAPPEAPAPETAAPSPEPAASVNPCDHLDPKVFDVEDIGSRTDISDAEKDRLRQEQAARRKVLFECFERAMKEKDEIDKKIQGK